MKLESKTGTILVSDEKIYNFLTNFNNFSPLIPSGKINDWQADNEQCSFKIPPVGHIGVKITECIPYNYIKLTNLAEVNYNFTIEVKIDKIEADVSHLKINMDMDINPMLQMLVKKPVSEFLDNLVDQLQKYNFS